MTSGRSAVLAVVAWMQLGWLPFIRDGYGRQKTTIKPLKETNRGAVQAFFDFDPQRRPVNTLSKRLFNI